MGLEVRDSVDILLFTSFPTPPTLKPPDQFSGFFLGHRSYRSSPIPEMKDRGSSEVDLPDTPAPV